MSEIVKSDGTGSLKKVKVVIGESVNPYDEKTSIRWGEPGDVYVFCSTRRIGLDPHFFGTHSLRRTKATLIYRRTGNLRAVQLLFGHTAYCPRTADGSQGPLPLPSAI